MNMNAKKRVNGSWVDAPYYIHKTAADTFTTLPVDVYADGNNATVGLKGNTVQNGTPARDNPIMPQGTGDLETSGEKAGQYKILISSANTTTPVYLGEVETTRKIKKLVLTGDEDWNRDGTSSDITRYRIALNDAYKSSDTFNTQFYISHYKIVAGGYTDNSSFLYNSKFAWLYICVDINTYPLTNDFKAYLAQQYAAGTPVTVWYVLATETTGVVNEPLMKIGNYADEVSNISIPTTTGKNIVDVETVLKPSEVSFNYAGWHTAVVHKRINGAWD